MQPQYKMPVSSKVLYFKGFPELQERLARKICDLDPIFARKYFQPKVTFEEQKKADDDILDFVKNISTQDKVLRGESGQKNEIFENTDSIQLQARRREIELEQQAKDMRLKGNEYMKSKEFSDALNFYEKAIQLYPKDASCHCNKAMAYLKLKNFSKAIESANKALDLQPDYLKALHRRGKAYFSTGKFKEAVRDFQRGLELEPENKELNKELRDARNKLHEAERKQGPTMEVIEEKVD